MLGEVVGAVGGSLASGLVNQHYSAKQAAKQMEFQERMSNTQYQRAAADLEKAGLNRVLALGSPASSPSGAMGSATVPDLGSVGSSAASAAAGRKLTSTQEKIAAGQLAMLPDLQYKAHNEANTSASNARSAMYDADMKELELAKQHVVKGLYDTLGPQAQSVLNSLPGMINNVKDAVEDVPKAIKSFPDFLKRKAEQGASSAFDAGKRWYLDDVWGNIRKYHPGLRAVDEIIKRVKPKKSGVSGSW